MPITIVKNFAKNNRDSILTAVNSVIEQAPLYNAAVGERGRLRYGMTNCGTYGWWSTQGYTRINPNTNQRWPQIPEAIANIMQPIGERFYPDFRLETVLINVYELDMNRPDRPILGFHQDTSERNKEAPIISISFGKGTFIVGGKVDGEGKIPVSQLRYLNKTLTTDFEIGDGDLVVMHSDERMCFHAAGEVIPSEELGDRRINLTGRMVDPLNREDKPIIFSFVGEQTLNTLPPPLRQEMDRAMTFRNTLNPRPNDPSEILLGSKPGFDRLSIDYLKAKRYPSVFVYNMGDRDIPRTFPIRNAGTEPAPLMEMLEESDYLLLATNGTERRTQFAKNYFAGLGKEIWEVLIPDERTDEGEPADSPEPPDTEPPAQPDSDRRPNSVGNCRITNIRDTGTDGLSATSWHNDDLSRVYIGRGGSQGIARSPLHNPYPISENTTREQSIDKFKRYSWPLIRDEVTPFYPAIRNIASLLAQGRDIELVCHCAPRACHGEVIHRAALWMIENNRVPYSPDAPVNSDGRLHLGLAGFSNLIGLTPRMELEIETLLVNRHREWYLKLNGVPTRNPVVHIRGSGTGFDRLVARYLIRDRYKDVVVHGGSLPSELPSELPWITSDEPLTANLNYLFVQWDEEDTELRDLIQQFNQPSQTLIAYVRKPKVNLPDPIPDLEDPQRFAKYGAAVASKSYVAVIGSREFRSATWAKNAIAQFINALPNDCTVISGGAKGADTYAADAAKARGLKLIVHPAHWVQRPDRLPNGQIDPDWKPTLIPPDRRPEDSNERANAGTERNKVIVDESNCLYAFSIKNMSTGTKDAFQYAALKKKSNLEMLFEEGAEKRSSNFSERAPFNLFYFDED